MKLDELISLLALIASIVALLGLSIDIVRQSYERWGLPFPRWPVFLKHSWISKHMKITPGVDGRWKLDWATAALITSLLGRNTIVFFILTVHGRSHPNWLITVTYVGCAVAAALTLKYSRVERRKRKP